MSLCLRFPSPRSTLCKNDLLVIGEGEPLPQSAQSRVVVCQSRDVTVGRHDLEEITVFVSGGLTSVPPPLRAGRGVDAARALATLYSESGSNAFVKVDGAFSAIVLDWGRDTVLLARDKLGIRRAYLHRSKDLVFFSDSLVRLRDASRQGLEVDLDTIATFLTIGWIPAPRSMFDRVQKIRPGTLVESANGTLTEKTYYEIPHSPTCSIRRPVEALREEVARQLDLGVARGINLEGQWGSFLSGGVDSSSVVSSLARQSRDTFPTYFGGFAPWLNRYLPNPEEPAMSQLVAARFRTNHRMIWIEQNSIESMPDVIEGLEEPVSDGGCIVIAEVMRAARTEVAGLMTGIGGDFLFTGERRHLVLNLLRYMRPVPDAVWQLLKRVSGAGLLGRSARVSQMHFDLNRLLAVRNLSLADMYIGFFRQATPAELATLLLPETRARMKRDPLAEIRSHFQDASDLDPLSQFLYVDLRANVPDDLVREAEALGSYFGVHVHHPFLQSEFVDFAMSIPADDKVNRLKLKVPLKAAMRGRLPDEILDRKKGGLGSPIRWWVSQADGFVASVLSRENMRRRGLFSPDAIDRFRQATAAGTADYTKLLWSLFTLELWMQRFVD